MTNGLPQTGASDSVRSQPVYAPSSDIWETPDRLILVIEIPGADPDGIDVGVERDELRIVARTASTAPEGMSLMHGEYRTGDYRRAFVLPSGIDAERIDATVKDGLLTLVLPKAAPPSRRIAVKTT